MAQQIIIALFAVILLSGCTSTTETPLSNNAWIIETEGRGLLGAAKVSKEIQKRAAEITLRQGFEKFILTNPNSNTGYLNVGQTDIYGNTKYSVSGNQLVANTRLSGGNPLNMKIKNSSVVVIMFSADDPNATNALDARQILASLSN